MYSLHYGQQCPPEWDDGSVPAETADWQKKKEHGKSNLHAEEDFLQKLESLNLDPRLKKLLLTYDEVFGALPPPLSCKKLVQMDLKLKPEFKKAQVRCRPYVVVCFLGTQCYGFEQQQRSSAQVASRSRNHTAVCE